VRRGAYGLLFVVLGYACLLVAAGVDLETRIKLLRYWTLLATAVYAIAVPHVLLPEGHLAMLQRLNRKPRGLLVHQLRAWSGVLTAFVVPGFALAFYDPGRWGDGLSVKALYLGADLLVALGVGLYSFGRYVNIGPTSQAWQERKRGGWYHALKAHSSGGGFAVPDGLVPALLVTQQVFGVGILVVAASAYAGLYASPVLAWGPGAVLLGWAVAKLGRLLPSYDHAFYATNAFYQEVFRSKGGVRLSDREPIPYRAVYWVPRRWTPAVWASLRQLDRALPLGRFIALGHAALWLLFFQDADADVIAVVLVLFIAAKNGTAFLLVTPSFAPFPFQAMRQRPAAWMATRFFVNLRWTLPFLGSLVLIAVLDPALGVVEALGWTGLDVAFALLTAFLFTYGTEFRYRNRYAA